MNIIVPRENIPPRVWSAQCNGVIKTCSPPHPICVGLNPTTSESTHINATTNEKKFAEDKVI